MSAGPAAVIFIADRAAEPLVNLVVHLSIMDAGNERTLRTCRRPGCLDCRESQCRFS